MDPSLLVDNKVAPYAIKYSSMTPLAFNSKPVPVVFATSNQSTYSQSNNLVKIPVSSATAFLEGTASFIKLKFTNKSLNKVRFNHSAHSLIEHLRVLTRGSEPLEHIAHYDKIHSLLADVNLSAENRLVRLQEGYSTNATPIVAAAAATVGNAFNEATLNEELAKLRAGLVSHDKASLKCVNELEVDVGAGSSVTLCIPLDLSATVGGAAKKLLPLWMMGEVTIELQLNKDCVFNTEHTVAGATAAAKYAAIANTAPTFEVSEVEFHAQLVEFESSVNQALVAMASGAGGGPALGLHLHGCTWSNQMVALAANQNTITCNERLRSLKSLFVSFIQNGMKYNRRKTARNNNAITSIQYKFGSQYLPTYPIRGNSAEQKDNGEYVVELLKAVSEYGNSMSTGLVNTESFAYSEPSPSAIAAAIAGGGADSYNPNACSRAAFGIDCDAFGKENVESGLNTTINTPINVQWQGGAGIPQDAYLFLYHDIVWNVMPNGVVSKSVM